MIASTSDHRGGNRPVALSEGTSVERTKLPGVKPTPTHPLRVAYADTTVN